MSQPRVRISSRSDVSRGRFAFRRASTIASASPILTLLTRVTLLALLALLALLTLVPDEAAAEEADVVLAQLDTGGQYNPRPDALRRLLWEVTQRTSIEASLEVVALRAEDPKLFYHPLLYWSGRGAVPALSDAAVKALRRYLTYGGTILIDSADDEAGGAFDQSVRREMGRILPRVEFARVPTDHVVYKSFFLVDHQAGRVLRAPYLEAIAIEKRFAVIYSQNDLAGAWARDSFGRWEYDVSPGGERQREMAFRLGINVVMYALCLDYKEDLVHIPFILKRRR
ncbi:MAG: DUF4159 domain-containing protein [Deltaproteobacteria bacterium]|nr:DUF4159 domain-containing protein [Deltaproteobacteria bacterium]